MSIFIVLFSGYWTDYEILKTSNISISKCLSGLSQNFLLKFPKRKNRIKLLWTGQKDFERRSQWFENGKPGNHIGFQLNIHGGLRFAAFWRRYFPISQFTIYSLDVFFKFFFNKLWINLKKHWKIPPHFAANLNPPCTSNVVITLQLLTLELFLMAILVFFDHLWPLFWSRGGQLLWFFIFSKSVRQGGSDDVWHVHF